MKKGRHILRPKGVCDGCWECRLYERVLPAAFLAGILVFLLYFVTLAPPQEFPDGSYARVSEGESLSQVAADFKARGLIRSAAVFQGLVRLFGGRTMYAGEYFFAGKEGAWTIAWRLARGDFELEPVKMVFWEGLTAKQMADDLAEKVPDFDSVSFLAAAKPKEGYLFPDTYFVLPGEDPLVLINSMERNFQIHAEEASSTIAAFGKPLSDVITMASLLEREAPGKRDRQIIAGILWRRIALGMPLQVDAVFPYILDKPGTELTRDDLKVDSPYNTYANKGLPPGPIANPGMSAIEAAVTPIKTSYLYYLSDRDGNFHYCATYSCHLDNVSRYLGN